MKNDNLKVNKESNSHYIGADKIVYRTDLGNSSKIVSMSNNSTSGSCIKKLSKYEYIDTRTGERKYYDLDKPTDIKDVKSMTEQELRGYDTSIQFIKDFEDGKVYPLDVFNNTKYIR